MLHSNELITTIMKKRQVYSISGLAKRLGIKKSLPFNGEIGYQYVIEGICYELDWFYFPENSNIEKVAFAVAKENVTNEGNRYFTLSFK